MLQMQLMYRSINAVCWSPAVLWKYGGTDGGFRDANAQDKEVPSDMFVNVLPGFVCKCERIKFLPA